MQFISSHLRECYIHANAFVFAQRLKHSHVQLQNVVLVRTFFHEKVKRHRLTFFSYHLFKTCNSFPVT